MPKNLHTQALLDEVKAPKHATRADGEAAVLAFLPELARLTQQATVEQTLVQTAEIAEEDDELRARFELYLQTAAAQRRICGEIERLARDLVTTLRQRERYDAEVRAAAQVHGYETGLPALVPAAPEMPALPPSPSPPTEPATPVGAKKP